LGTYVFSKTVTLHCHENNYCRELVCIAGVGLPPSYTQLITGGGFILEVTESSMVTYQAATKPSSRLIV